MFCGDGDYTDGEGEIIVKQLSACQLVKSMNNHLLLSELQTYLEGVDVPIVGVTKPFYDGSIADVLKEHVKENNYVFFGDVTLEQRQNIEAVFPQCEQIIVIGIPYDSKNTCKNHAISQGGYISNMAWGYDYHHVLHEKLNQLAGYLKARCPSIKTLGQVDTGPLIDRHIAYRAGLGSYAKNQNLLHEAYGTEFYIGYLLVDKEMIADGGRKNFPLRAEACKNCSACVKACPAKVLGEDFSFKGNRCISYLTQKKENLSVDEMALIGKNVYGCDICQLVCPINRQKKEIPTAYKRDSINLVPLEEFITSSNKALIRSYKESGFAWRGAKVLKRNALIAMGHYENEDNILFLKERLSQKNDDLMPAILWSLYRSKAQDIQGICEDLLKSSEHSQLIIACQHILQLLK